MAQDTAAERTVTTSIRQPPALLADFARVARARGSNTNRLVGAFMRKEIAAHRETDDEMPAAA